MIICMDAPPNRGSFNSAHIFGTYVPGGGAVHSKSWQGRGVGTRLNPIAARVASPSVSAFSQRAGRYAVAKSQKGPFRAYWIRVLDKTSSVQAGAARHAITTAVSPSGNLPSGGSVVP